MKTRGRRRCGKPNCQCHGGNRQQNPVEQFQGQGDQNSGQTSNRIVRHSSDSHRNCDEQEITKITQNQQAIIHEISTAPYSIIAVLPSQVQFVDDLQMVTRLIVGIVVSYGAMNQMEKSERKILLDYALGEVKTLSRNSTHMLLKIRDIKAKVLRNKRAFQYYVNRDKQVVENIMKTSNPF